MRPLAIRLLFATSLIAGCSGADESPPADTIEVLETLTRLEQSNEALASEVEGLTREVAALRAAVRELEGRPLPRPRPGLGPRPGPQLGAPGIPDDVAERIACADDRCTLERGLLDELLANPEGLARQARVVPSQKDGQPDGFRLFGVRRGSIPDLLGFRNGDTIRSVNGKPLTDPSAALEIYTEFKGAGAQELRVELLRRGEPRTHVIAVGP